MLISQTVVIPDENLQGHGQLIRVGKYADSLRSRGKFLPKPIKIGKSDQKKRALVRAIKPKLVPIEQVEIGDIVLCRLRGFCAWPSTVVAIEKTVIDVEFFGDQSTPKTSIKNIFKFSESAEVILDNLKGRKNPLLSKAVREAEIMLGIPMNLVQRVDLQGNFIDN